VDASRLQQTSFIPVIRKGLFFVNGVQLPRFFIVDPEITVSEAEILVYLDKITRFKNENQRLFYRY
jgi:hypothetical protein